MAFYSILFAILFLGAFREVIRSLGELNWQTFWIAATLTMVIFNDVLYTSHFIEEKKAHYSILMKMNDIVSFILLGAALLVLQPGKENIFEVPAGPWVTALPRLSAFWGLLAVYWLTVITWNLLGSFYSEEHVSISIHVVILLGFVAILVASFLSLPWAAVIGPCVVFILFTFYMCVIKPILLRERGAAPTGS